MKTRLLAVLVLMACPAEGPKGDPGERGPQGERGPAGMDGMNGMNGMNGMPGTPGTPGLDGMNGTNGTNGTNGMNGAPGMDGMNGAPGADGVSVTVADAGAPQCPNGGVAVTGANGTRYVCNGAQGNAGPTSVVSCPAGMTRVDLPHETICWNNGTSSNWASADDYCDNLFRAQLCTLKQWRSVVCRAALPNPGRSWLNEPTGAGTFATVLSCAGDGVGSAAYTVSLQGPCCLSWPRY